jgi:hypothetical protein
MLSANVRAQTFNSGSNGSDGALSLTVAGTYTFDPNDVTTWGRVLDPDGDGVYHFTTINIGAGVTLKFSSTKTTRPIFWLASGAVTISGTLDLSGGNFGSTTSNLDQRRTVPVPGPGGYAGGAGGNNTVAPQAGQGPGGGAAGTAAGSYGTGGTYKGNRFLVPLVGGSGGGGYHNAASSSFGSPGGAGGGAIAIMSSISITMASTSAIKARGGEMIGNCPTAGGGIGSGGAIRLAAVSIITSGTPLLDVSGGNTSSCSSIQNASAGQVRIEAFQNQSNFNVVPISQGSTATPFNAFLPTSSVRVVKVNGIALPPNPSASFTLPDVTINQSQAVTIEIEAKNIPIGTIVNLEVFAENPSNLAVVNEVAASTPLGGTVALSTATASFTFPPGFSRCFVRATWTQ